jgi:hypothetical protein
MVFGTKSSMAADPSMDNGRVVLGNGVEKSRLDSSSQTFRNNAYLRYFFSTHLPRVEMMQIERQCIAERETPQ